MVHFLTVPLDTEFGSVLLKYDYDTGLVTMKKHNDREWSAVVNFASDKDNGDLAEKLDKLNIDGIGITKERVRELFAEAAY